MTVSVLPHTSNFNLLLLLLITMTFIDGSFSLLSILYYNISEENALLRNDIKSSILEFNYRLWQKRHPRPRVISKALMSLL